MKTCSKCKIEKPFEDFGKRASSVDGYRGQCRSCVNTRAKSRKPEVEPRPCRHCGTDFTPENNRYKFCSTECKEAGRDAVVRKSMNSDKRKEYQKRYRKTEKARTRMADYNSRPEVKEARREAGRRFDKSHKGRWRAFETKIRSQGGFLDDTFENYLEHCDKTHCDVCGVEMTSNRNGGDMRCVDHCHTTGKIRGALCMKCNSAEGYLKSDVEIVRNLLNYLERTNGN